MLARHRYLTCVHRQLADEAEFSAEALSSLHARLEARRSLIAAHLRRFATVVGHRKLSKRLLAEVKLGLGFLHANSASLGCDPNDPPPLPLSSAPAVGREPACHRRLPGHAARIRSLAARIAHQSAARTSELADLKLQGGMHAGVWGEVKALLEMTPQRALLHGGMAALAAEAQRDALLRRWEAGEVEEAEAEEAALVLVSAEDGLEGGLGAVDNLAEGLALLSLVAQPEPAEGGAIAKKEPKPALPSFMLNNASDSTVAIAATALRLVNLRKPLAIGKHAQTLTPRPPANAPGNRASKRRGSNFSAPSPPAGPAAPPPPPPAELPPLPEAATKEVADAAKLLWLPADAEAGGVADRIITPDVVIAQCAGLRAKAEG